MNIMNTTPAPRDASTAVVDNPTLPPGDDERFVGFGVMGLPFSSGHYLALRDFPASSFSPGYRSVWHRDPSGTWTFYATAPGQLSCARYFSSATTVAPVECDIDVAWLSPWSLRIRMGTLLDWQVDIATSVSTRLMTAIGSRLPEGAWTNRPFLAVMSRAAGPMLGVGKVRLAGTAPNGQDFMIAPTRLWPVKRSRALFRGEDLGPVGPLEHQLRLGDFRLPQRGICVVGHGHFEAFDATRHHSTAESAGGCSAEARTI
jgi:hypothetical protein